MATVYQTLLAVCKKQKLRYPFPEICQLIGKKVAEAYHQQGIKKYLHRIQVNEKGKKINVLRYPKEFIPEIKKIIQHFVDTKSIVKVSAGAGKSYRKKVPKSQKTEYSKKNYNKKLL